MRKIQGYVWVLAAVFAVSGLRAADTSTRVKAMVDDFYKAKFILSKLNSLADRERKLGEPDRVREHGRNDCPKDPKACVDFFCAKLGSFGCDEEKEVLNVLRVCRGNFGAACVTTVCKKLGSFGCDEFKEVEQVANACRGNYDGDCIEMVCERLGSFGCDELKEIIPIAQACGGGHP